MFRSGKIKSLGMILLLLVTAASIYGFAAANTVPDTAIGEATGNVCGYTITNIAYSLNGTTPSNLDQVGFDVDVDVPCSGNPTFVEIRVDSSSSDWYSCTAGTPPAWTCATTSPQVSVIDADQLQIVAAE